MEGSLKGLFGGGEETHEKSAAHDFIQRVTTGDPTEGYSQEEAHERVSQVMKHASRDTLNRAFQQSVGNLNEDQRKQFAEMLKQRAAKGRPESSVQASASDSMGLDDLLGGLMGGGSGGGLGDVLGGLLGGGGGNAHAQSGGSDQGGGMFDDLGDLLNSPIGKAAMAGMAAFAMKEILGK
jgi:hypothetical protein